MRAPAILLLTPLILAAGARAAEPLRPVSPLVVQADDYYLGRWRIENVVKGLALLREAVARNPQDYESWWRIAEFTSYLARHEDGPKEMSELEQGIEAGKKAAALAPNRPEGHYWLGADYGLYAREKNLIQGMRYVDRIRGQMQIVEKIDPNYNGCGAERILARVDYEAPFFKGGDKHQSVNLLEDCLKRDPKSSLTMLYLAESLLAVGRRDQARARLEDILKLCPDPIYGPEQEENKASARELLSKEFGKK
jgi:tetratricopeptide (TPR) repeat protein